jgi:hypothetical protein
MHGHGRFVGLEKDIKENIIKGMILHAEKTTLQVHREQGRSAKNKFYMWLYRNGRAGPAIVLFDYRTTRANKHPRRTGGTAPLVRNVAPGMPNEGLEAVIF